MEKTAPDTASPPAIGDFIKRALLAGVGVLFMTEESIRSALGELKLPKEAVQFVVGQVARSKEELFKIIAREIRSFLENADFQGQLTRLLSTTAFEIEARVRLVPAEKGENKKSEEK
jgi:hypothetical protein